MMPVNGSAPVAETVAMAECSVHSDCSGCLHCTNQSNMRNSTGVRISVNLQQFFSESDERAHVFMWAPYERCVQWLRRRIVNVFGLPENIALVSGGHLLPAFEPLLILNSNDRVEVVNTSNVLKPDSKRDIDESVAAPTLGTGALTGRAETNVQSESTTREYRHSVGGRDDHVAEPGNDSEEDFPAYDMDTTTGSLESRNVDDNDNLQKLKQRALRLLDEHCYRLQEAAEPKRVRRRRRRRRLPAAPDGDVASAAVHSGSDSRPPRLVRALSP